MPLRRAIEIMMLAERQLVSQTESEAGTTDAGPAEDGGTVAVLKHPEGALFDKAVDLYYGIGDELKDQKAAFDLLNRLRTMNFAPAYTPLAAYFMDQAEWLNCTGAEEGIESKRLYAKAVHVLKDGAHKGHGRCWVALARMFAFGQGTEDGKRQPEDSLKCWKKYFRSQTFLLDDNSQWTEGFMGLGIESDCSGRSRVQYAADFLYSASRDELPLDSEILRIIAPLKSDILCEAMHLLTLGSEAAVAYANIVKQRAERHL